MSGERPWRTNVGLRLTEDLGAWLETHCAAENRTFANFVETLVIRERERLAGLGEFTAMGDEPPEAAAPPWTRFANGKCRHCRTFRSVNPENVCRPCHTGEDPEAGAEIEGAPI